MDFQGEVVCVRPEAIYQVNETALCLRVLQSAFDHVPKLYNRVSVGCRKAAVFFDPSLKITECLGLCVLQGGWPEGWQCLSSALPSQDPGTGA